MRPSKNLWLVLAIVLAGLAWYAWRVDHFERTGRDPSVDESASDSQE
jgi:hypothetical protein